MTDTQQQFKLISPSGEIIAQGSMPAVMEHLPDTKARANAIENMLRVEARAAKAEETLEEARTNAAKYLCDSVARLTEHMDAFIKRRADQRQRELEEEELEELEEIERELDALPDPDDPDAPATYSPNGELHALAPKDQDPQGIIPPPQDPEGAVLDQGALPNELQKGPPPPTGTAPELDPEKLAYPETPAQRQPVAISLMAEE